MLFSGRFNTVFYRLVISYIVLTLTITVILGVTSYIYFTSNFNREIKNVNQKILEYEKNSIDTSIFQRVVLLYRELSIPQYKNEDFFYLINHPIQGNHSKVQSSFLYLKEMVAYNSDILESIHVYYPNDNIIVSSSLGIKYLEQYNPGKYNELDWLQIRKIPKTGLWIETRELPSSISLDTEYINVISFVQTIFVPQNPSDEPAMIAINIKESAISNIIAKLTSNRYDGSFIIDRNGKVISHINKEKLNEELVNRPYIEQILNSEDSYGGFIAKVDGTTSMVSFATLWETGWKLVNYTPVHQFYKQSSIIQRMLILICIVSIIIGMILTNIFTLNIYNPLKILMASIKKLFGDSNTSFQHINNEYTLINNVMNNLSVKVNELEDIIKENKPLIKHNLVLSLLNNSIASETELKDKQQLLGLSFVHPYFACMLIDLGENHIKRTSVENYQFIKYNLIKEIEKSSDVPKSYIAAELSDSKIGIIVNSMEQDIYFASKLASQIKSYSHDDFRIYPAVSISMWTDNPLKLYLSYKEAEIFLKYKFFATEACLLTGNEFINRERSTEKIADPIFEDFLKGLHLQNIDMVEETLDKFTGYVKKGNFSANHCNEKILYLATLLSTYIDEIHFELNEKYKSVFFDTFQNLCNIDHFKSIVLELIHDVFDFIVYRNNSFNAEAIEKAKLYICSNLDKEISLNALADVIELSPKYLSRLFKDVAGINYMDFITEKRMEKAKELLIQSNLTIDQIAYKVGYCASAYFIKKFKETYGDTPRNYRRYSN